MKESIVSKKILIFEGKNKPKKWLKFFFMFSSQKRYYKKLIFFLNYLEKTFGLSVFKSEKKKPKINVNMINHTSKFYSIQLK